MSKKKEIFAFSKQHRAIYMYVRSCVLVLPATKNCYKTLFLTLSIFI